MSNYVLLVDYEADAIAMLNTGVHIPGLEVRTASNYLKVLDTFRNIMMDPPLAILIDTTVPVVDSKAIRQWLSLSPHTDCIPLVLVSAAEPEQSLPWLLNGVAGKLTKVKLTPEGMSQTVWKVVFGTGVVSTDGGNIN